MKPPPEMVCRLPLAEIKASKTNPRQSFPDDSLRELADSIKAVGVLQDILVRPVPVNGKPPKFDGRKWQHVGHFEIIAGERRFRAAKLAGLADIGAKVVCLPDAEVLALQLIENDQREDVRPSEQAAAYKRLVDAVGLAEAARQIGKPEATVRGIALLARAPIPLAAAVDAGLVGRSVAELVCRVPGERSRAMAAYCVLTGQMKPSSDDEWNAIDDVRPNIERGNGVLTHRETKELIARHFTRELKAAPFSRKTIYQLPNCEPGHEQTMHDCDGCPKRAGNDQTAKAEGVRGDICLDPECYGEKVEAHRRAEIERFAKRHKMDPADVQTVEMTGTVPPPGWVDVNAAVLDTELARDGDGYTDWKRKPKPGVTALELLTDLDVACPCPHLAIDAKGKPHTLVKTTDVRRALIATGLIVKREKPAPRPAVPANGKPATTPSEDGPYLLYRVRLNPDVMPAVEFDAAEGTTPDELREQATSAFMDWFDGIDWTDAKLIPRPFVDYERVPEPEATPAPVQTPAPGPVVCAPVGSGRLADIPGIDADDAKCLAACGITTLAGLEQRLDALRAERGRQNATIYDVLRSYPGVFTPGDCTRIGDAITDHLNVGKAVSAAADAKGKRKGVRG